MSDAFDVDGILAEFGITPVELDEPKKEPVRRKRVVVKAEPKETLITQVERMREVDAEKVRKFAESLKGKKIAKVREFLREIAKKKVAKRRPVYKPSTEGDVIDILLENGWTTPSTEIVVRDDEYGSRPIRVYGTKKYPTPIIISPDKDAYMFRPPMSNYLKQSTIIARGPLVKEGDEYLLPSREKHGIKYLVWKTEKEAVEEAEEKEHYIRTRQNPENRRKGRYVIDDPHKYAFEGLDKQIYLPDIL